MRILFYLYIVSFYFILYLFFFFFSSRRRHTRLQGDWSSDVCSSDLDRLGAGPRAGLVRADPDMIDAHDADQVLDVPGKVVQGRLCGLGDEPRDDDDPEKPAAVGDRLRQLIALPAVVVADGLAGGMGDHDRSGRHLEGVPPHLLAAVTDVDENPGRVQAPHH